jgi:hypothetical protein
VAKKVSPKIDSQTFWNEFPKVLEVLDNDWKKGTNDYGGTFKTAYFNDTTDFPECYVSIVDYFKTEFNCCDFQFFISTSENEGIGWHTDAENVLIFGLFGELEYQLYNPEHFIEFKAGDSLFLPENKPHLGKSLYTARIVLTMQCPSTLTPDQVTHHYSAITGDYS